MDTEQSNRVAELERRIERFAAWIRAMNLENDRIKEENLACGQRIRNQRAEIRRLQDFEPCVEVWNGVRKVTVYPPRSILRSWGSNMETEMADEPYTLQAVQEAMDWLYEEGVQA